MGCRCRNFLICSRRRSATSASTLSAGSGQHRDVLFAIEHEGHRSADAGRQGQQNSTALEPIAFAQLNLRQKLAVVRRRLVYVQKRGHNPRFNYNYVTAADIAGAVGDILAELGVVVVPRLESISHEATRAQGRTEGEHIARVVMSYSFVDVDTAEEITVKTAGEGLDSLRPGAPGRSPGGVTQ